jgi:LacI family transcriptional regulator
VENAAPAECPAEPELLALYSANDPLHMASIKDVAEYAGVSIATVSHVLNGTRNVRPETRQRVLAGVERLGYAPNLVARRLAGGPSQLLGVVVSDLRNPFFPEITTAFQEQALLREMDSLVIHTNYESHRTLVAVRRLIGLQVPGVAILTSQIEDSIIELLREKGLCAVYLDLGRVERRISNLAIDYEHGIAEALGHLRQLGHRRIGFIGGKPTLPSACRRKSAFSTRAAADPEIETRICDADFTVQGGYFACAKLITGWMPTALIAANDLMAIGAMHCCWDRSLRVPQDLSIVGFDDITFAEYTQPSLTTVHVPRARIGVLAFESLWKMLSDASHRGVESSVTTTLSVRGSTAPPNPAR